MDKPLRPMANRSCGCFVWALAPFLLVWCFAVCFAVSSGETQVWLGDLRVVVFGWFWLLCVFLIDLPAQMDMICPCTNAYLAYAHVRAEPLAQHRPHSRKKKCCSLVPSTLLGSPLPSLRCMTSGAQIGVCVWFLVSVLLLSA